jgi:hypothetical protein
LFEHEYSRPDAVKREHFIFYIGGIYERCMLELNLLYTELQELSKIDKRYLNLRIK